VTLIYKMKPRLIIPQKWNDGPHNYPSVRLIQWADVVISSISSIVLDIFYLGKIFLYPKYVGPNDIGEFEEFNACWRMDNEDELIATLRGIYDGKEPPYRIEDVKMFCRKMIYDGDADILSLYSDFYGELDKKQARMNSH